MGFTPDEVDRQEFWSLLAAIDGWNRAHSPRGGRRHGVDAELLELAERARSHRHE